MSLDDRRPRSLAELVEHLLALGVAERLAVLRQLPSGELEALSPSAKASPCRESVVDEEGKETEEEKALRIRMGFGPPELKPCGEPGRVRFCDTGVCPFCCDAHACEISALVPD